MGLDWRWRVLVASATAMFAICPVAILNVSAESPQPVDLRAPAAASQSQITHPAAYVPLRGAVGFGPRDAIFKNLDYNGGPVMPSNTNYLVFWSPSGLGAYPAGYVTGLKLYFKDLAHDSGGHQNTDSTSTQYRDLTGAFANYSSTFGGGLLDGDPYPASQCPAVVPVTNCLTDAQIQTELEKFVFARHLKKDLTHEYFMLTPPHVEGCFTNSPPTYGGCSAGQAPALAVYCAYHQNTSLSPFLIYASDPYVVGNSGCDDGNHPNGIWDGELSGGLSHEHNESVTDPIPNDAWTNGAGTNQGLENGDQCAGSMGTPLGTHNGAKYNQVINGHFYWYQEEWSNAGHACLQRLPAPATMPAAKLAVTAGTGLTLNFDATGSTAPGGVAYYVWQFNDAFGAQTVEQTTPTISHTFPTAGAYSVGLTIFAHDGLSTGTGGLVTTGSSGFTLFTFSPANPVYGQKVTFNGLTTVSAQPVLVYLWEFGDGSIGSGPHPKHSYVTAGTYTVTLVMFSGTGSAFPGQGAGPIVTRTITVT